MPSYDNISQELGMERQAKPGGPTEKSQLTASGRLASVMGEERTCTKTEDHLFIPRCADLRRGAWRGSKYDGCGAIILRRRL